MRHWNGTLALAAAFAAILVLGCGHKDRPAPRAVGEAAGLYRLSVRNRPQTPIVGENKLEIAIRDTTGAPVEGAQVDALVSMQAMGAMPRMENRGRVVRTSAGLYEASYSLPMGGEWDVGIRIRGAGGSAEASYRLSTSQPELSFMGGTPPAGGAGSPPAEDLSGVVRIDPARRQAVGVRTEAARLRDLSTTIRAAGRVTYDETRRAEVSPKFSGWVRDIHVDYTGKPVRAGEVLFTAYSPELVAAQQEYLTALGAAPDSGSAAEHQHGEAGGPPAGDRELAAAARERLLHWDIAPAQIDAIARAGKPIETLPILAPETGVVIEKNVVRGSAFTAGQTLYKIAPIHPVWVIASVYPYELPWVRIGMAATILSPFLHEASRAGRVSTIDPYLDPQARTAQVRVVVPNTNGDLKPDMFVDVLLSASRGKRLAIPQSAVLYAGDKRLVFVDLGDGRFAAREVTLGAKAGDDIEVVSGLEAGEVVVTSGNFLIASESRLKSAAQKW
ncbi:MAG TPA: efflux RND transporter periplasmic adaptor subunit [Candidatus Binatia bacterium]|nr:efflux RND transporter periplasmic adaptor subunit [Candidatus Binatia bacterium]